MEIQGDSCDFAMVLSGRSRQPGLRKTDRTRLVLLASLAGELAAEGGRGGLRVAAVAARAGVAHGTYYRYFDDVDVGVDALIDAFSAFVRARLDGAQAGEPGSRERIRSMVVAQVALFRDNGALMATLLSADEEAPDREGRQAARVRVWEWLMRLAAIIARGRSAAPGANRVTPKEMLPVAFALAGMLEAFLGRVYLSKEPELADLAEDEEALAGFLTDLWWRAAFGDPPA